MNDYNEIREQIERAIDDPGYYVDHDVLGFNGLDHSSDAVMAVIAPLLAQRDAAIERAELAEAEVKRLAGARLTAAVFGTPKDAPQPFSLVRGSDLFALGVQWPGGAVTIKSTPPERLGNTTSHSLEDAFITQEFPDDVTVIWLSEDLGTLADTEERAEQAEAEVEKLNDHHVKMTRYDESLIKRERTRAEKAEADLGAARQRLDQVRAYLVESQKHYGGLVGVEAAYVLSILDAAPTGVSGGES